MQWLSRRHGSRSGPLPNRCREPTFPGPWRRRCGNRAPPPHTAPNPLPDGDASLYGCRSCCSARGWDRSSADGSCCTTPAASPEPTGTWCWRWWPAIRRGQLDGGVRIRAEGGLVPQPAPPAADRRPGGEPPLRGRRTVPPPGRGRGGHGPLRGAASTDRPPPVCAFMGLTVDGSATSFREAGRAIPFVRLDAAGHHLP